MLRVIAGIIIGYLIFAVPSYLMFRLTHVDPHAPASPVFEATAGILGMILALLAGYLGTVINRRSTMGIALTICCHPRCRCNFQDGCDRSELVADRSVNWYGPGSSRRRRAALTTTLSKTANGLRREGSWSHIEALKGLAFSPSLKSIL